MISRSNHLKLFLVCISLLLSGHYSNAQARRNSFLHMFVDVGYSYTTNDAPEKARGFLMNNFDLFFNPQISNRDRVLVELLYETHEGSYVTDVERMQIGHSFSNALFLWAGRFHTPYGYWNAEFHHGAQLQTSVVRPKFVNFEDDGGIVPAHSVGLWGTGTLGKFQYDLYIANGSKIESPVAAAGATVAEAGTLNPNISTDDNNGPLIGFNLSQKINNDNVRVGLHGYTQGVSVYDTSIAGVAPQTYRAQSLMLGGYLVVDNGSIESISEYYNFSNKNEFGGNTGSNKSWAGFTQFAYNMDKSSYFVRYERAVLDQNDFYFLKQASGRSYDRIAGGIKYNLGPDICVKLEITHSMQEEATGTIKYNEGKIQYAIYF
jgi:hypothetical protein